MRQYPLSRLLLPFIAGIVTSGFINKLSNISVIILFSLIITLFLIIILFNQKIGYSYRWLKGLFVSTIFYSLGIIYCNFYNNALFQTPTWVSENTHSYEVEIIDYPVLKSKTIKLTAQISLNSDTIALHGEEKLMLFIHRDSLSEKICYGDKLKIYTKLSEIVPPLNPYEFDYRQFLLWKGIRYQAYVPSYAWEKTSVDNGNVIQAWAYRARTYFMSIFEEQEMDIQEMGIVTAILLGYDENIDPELAKHYTGAGVSHILSVSGMHVGVIYLFLNFLLGFLDKRKGGKIAKSILLLLLVWFYAFLTGLSPSVLRAATMFTFVIIGTMFNRHVEIYNSLLTSLFFLLIIDPNLIYSVGFQLSYLAVFSIVWLQKPIYNLWKPRYKAIDYIWQLTSVSIAAQALTTPICLYYFHQFPNYFILANILIPLLSSIVMYLGIAVISFSFIPFLSAWLNQLLVWSVKFMNFMVVSIHKLPGSVASNIDIDFVSSLLLYGCFLFTISYLMFKKRPNWWLSLTFWVVFMVYISVDKFSDYHNNKITFYSIRNQSLIEIKVGDNAISIMDSTLMAKPDAANFFTASAQVRNRISTHKQLCFSDTLGYSDDFININRDFLLAGNQSVLFIDKRMASKRTIIPKVHVDVAYVHSNPWIDIETLSQKIQANIWVFDRSNSTRNTQRMVEECDQLGLNYRDLSVDGAFELPLH